MKFREYYKEDNNKKRRERRSAMSSEDKAEVEELRQKVSMLEAKQATSMDKEEVDKLFEQGRDPVWRPQRDYPFKSGGLPGPVEPPA